MSNSRPPWRNIASTLAKPAQCVNLLQIRMTFCPPTTRIARGDILSVRLRFPCLRLRPNRPAPASQAALAGDRGALTDRTQYLKSGSHGVLSWRRCTASG